ncbi:MAG: ATP-binding protein [Bacteroidales bacterium]|nr:ATP-binding protein [Bacteroidales bacterium]
MHYIFVINGRQDKKWVADEVDRQIREAGSGFDYEIYTTTGVGDGTRFVRIYCDLHPHAKVCFVACGGTGTLNEVASGLVGFADKQLAYLAFGATNDFIKCFPDRDFCSLRRILAGEERKVDILRVNDSYSINVVNIGFDAVVASTANHMVETGRVRHAYDIGIAHAVLTSRRNRIQVIADGQRMNRRKLMLCTLSNGRYCGGEFFCAPRADVSDGLAEVCLVRPMLLLTFLLILPFYRRGEHLDRRRLRHFFRYRRARHIEVVSRNLIELSVDGELVSGHHFQIDVLPQSVSFILPSIVTMKKRFEPIIDKCGEIIDYLMSSPDIPKDEALQFKIRLSIEEAVENVVRYAYEGGMGWIEVGTELDPEGVMLTILLRDAGVPFNPLDKPDPDISLSAEDRQIGGLGIFLCKKLMDHIEYKYEDGCNILLMTKKVA